MSSVRSSTPDTDSPTLDAARGHRSRRRLTPLAVLLAALLLSPLTAGCLERSTTVGDRYSGNVIVATLPGQPAAYRGHAGIDARPGLGDGIQGEPGRRERDDKSGDEKNEEKVTRVGTRASFTDLTAGQFGQLGDIVADAYGETSLTMDLTAKRSGEVVRFRGDTDLSELVPNRDHVQLTVTFGGPVTATNGEQVGESTVTWTPKPGEPSDLSADATYPDPATAAVSSWSWFLAIVCLLVVAVIARMAYRMRYKGPRPGRPTKNTT